MLDREIESKIQNSLLKEAAERARYLCFVLGLAFGVYGVTSTEFINKFDPSISIWDNNWPRIFFNTIPFMLLGLIMNFSWAPKIKIAFFSFGFSIIFHCAAWINIWPIALSGHPEILTYVNGANLFLIAAVYSVISPSKKIIFQFSFPLMMFFIFPLFMIAHMGKDPVVKNLVINDTCTVLFSSIFLGLGLSKFRYKLARMDVDRNMHASKFLGPVISKAIFSNEQQLLEHVRCKGFVISIDIRDSTDLLQAYGTRWLAFRSAYFKLVSQVVAENHGYIQKTVGDCHVINFGVMEYQNDLEGIPGIEEDLKRAEERRLHRASQDVYRFVDQLFSRFAEMSRQAFPERPIYLGAGVDKGWVERGVHGDEKHNLELDVNGDPVNCSNRLQEYSKAIRNHHGWQCSIMVISPFASDYLEDLSTFTKVLTEDHPVRNYPGIRWVLAKKFHESAEVIDLQRRAA